jgi:putative oxidoreductase
MTTAPTLDRGVLSQESASKRRAEPYMTRPAIDSLHLWDRFTEPAYALLRFAAGLLFACHGAQKLFGALGGEQVSELASLQGVAGIIELVAGLLVAFGLFASWAGLLASGEMFVAYFMAHAPKGAVPIENGGELALLYAFAFLYVAAHGAGAYSLDALIHRPRLHRPAPVRR